MRIAVIGIGNTGSYTAVMLYGLAPKELCLIDKDIVEATNIQRQFMYSEKDVSRPKVEAAKDFLLSRFKGLKTKVKTLAADVRYLEDFDFDFVFSCVDNMPARKAILEKCLEKGIPLIDMGLEFYESQAGHVLLVDKKRFPGNEIKSSQSTAGLNGPRSRRLLKSLSLSSGKLSRIDRKANRNVTTLIRNFAPLRDALRIGICQYTHPCLHISKSLVGDCAERANHSYCLY